MTSKGYKYCAVPLCRSTTIATPHKLFLHVPRKKIMRDKWMKLARRKPADSYSSTLYFCEDHFDLPNDMANYMQYHLMGSVSQLRMKPGSIPKKFACQADRRSQTSYTIERPYLRKKKMMMDLEECEIQLEESSMVKDDFDFEETASGSSDKNVIVKTSFMAEDCDAAKVKTETSNTLQVDLNLGIKKEAHDGEAIKLEREDEDLNHSYSEIAEEEALSNNTLYKAGCDSGDSEQMTIKTEYPLEKVQCYDVHRNDVSTPSYECDIDIKQENYDTEIEKIEINEHDVIGKSKERSERKVKLEEQPEAFNDVGIFKTQFRDCRVEANLSPDEQPELSCSVTPDLYQFQGRAIRTKDESNSTNHDKPLGLSCSVTPDLSQYQGIRTKHKSNSTNHDKQAKWHMCRDCPYRTKKESSLKKHIAIEHDEEGEWYQCQDCEYRTGMISLLSQHFSLKHANQWYQHQDCDYRTKYITILRRNVKVKT